MKVLHTADLHLQELGDDRWKALESLVDLARDQHVSVLAISGDLFDSNVDAERLRVHLRELLSNPPFQTLIIPGNHDAKTYRPGMYFGEQVTYFAHEDYRRNTYETENVLFVGLPFQPIGSLDFLRRLRALTDWLPQDRTNILLYHGELLDAVYSRSDFGPEGDSRYMPAYLAYFADMPVHYVLAGHFHTNFTVHDIGSKRYFVYPGSPISMTRREFGQRKVNLFQVGNQPHPYVLNTPHYVEMTITFKPTASTTPLEQVRERLAKTHPAAIVMLTVEGYVDEPEEKLVRELNELIGSQSVERTFRFKNVRHILDDPVFLLFSQRLSGLGDKERSERLRDLALDAMITAGL